METNADLKAFIKACSDGNMDKIKVLIAKGVEPEQNFDGVNGLLSAMRAHAWYHRNKPNDKTNISKCEEAIKYLIDVVDFSKYSTSPLCDLLWRIQTGENDKTVEFVLDNGYPLAKDKDVFLMAGLAGFPLAKRIVDVVGLSDKTVFFAVHNESFMNYLMDNNVSLNTPFTYSGGNKEYPINAALGASPEFIKRMLDNGADPDLINDGYQKSTREIVLENEYIREEMKALFR